MSRKQGALDRAADRMMGLESASYGDERERAVFMEATTFGYATTIYTGLTVALVAAVLGELLLPAVVLLLVGVPSWATIWYAGRRGVDVEELSGRAEGRVRTVVGAVVFGGIALALAAMAYTVFVGHGLVALPEIDLAGPDASGVMASLVRGAVIGGAGGLLVGAVVLAVKYRRGAAPRPVEDADED